VRPRLAAVLLVLAVAGLAIWHAELFTVSRPGDAPRPLARATHAPLPPFAVTLPRVPVGAVPVASGRTVWLVHYWAPWERHGRAQAIALDSLVRTLPEVAEGRLRVAIVCFDPFPSVARFVARLRLTVPVLLDHRRELQRVLPCPSLPWTWVFDAGGQVVVTQSGEVDWHAPETRALLREVLAHGSPGIGPATSAPESTTPRGVDPPGRRERLDRQPRAVAVSGRGNQRVSSAWAPNRTAL
jgi:hypothetical protein